MDNVHESMYARGRTTSDVSTTTHDKKWIYVDRSTHTHTHIYIYIYILSQVSLYHTYLASAKTHAGVVHVRAIYERALEHLPDDVVWQMALKFASFEAALGELDRARAIYRHASQFCDPRVKEESFWKVDKSIDVDMCI
jgi:hypothetical protein